MRNFLRDVLESYERNSVTELGCASIKNFLAARYGTLSDAGQKLGVMQKIRQAFAMFRDICIGSEWHDRVAVTVSVKLAT